MANELRGFEGKLKIGGAFFDVKEYSININRSLARTDTTGTGRYQSSVVDKEVLEVSFKAISKSNINPHATPSFIMATPQYPNVGLGTNNIDGAAIKFWPDGNSSGAFGTTADDTKAYRMTVNWETFNLTGQAESGLIMLDAKGTSTGEFQRPGDA